MRRPRTRPRSLTLALSFAVAIAFILVNVVDPYSGAANAATAFTVVTTEYRGHTVQTYVVAGAYQNVVSRDALSVKAAPPPATVASSSSRSGSAAPAAGTPDPGSAQAIAYADLQARGWGSQYSCLVALWNKESHWNVYAANPDGAYGIPQALPGSKMASAGPNWQSDAATQITWGLGYIASRWGTPCAAWAHSQATGWY